MSGELQPIEVVEGEIVGDAAAGPPPLTRARHRAALQTAVRWLADAAEAGEPELRGEAMRLALSALGAVTGKVGVEDILDSIFREFCIGK